MLVRDSRPLPPPSTISTLSFPKHVIGTIDRAIGFHPGDRARLPLPPIGAAKSWWEARKVERRCLLQGQRLDHALELVGGRDTSVTRSTDYGALTNSINVAGAD